MLVVILEIHPGGDASRKREIGRAEISNLTELAEVSDYAVTFSGESGVSSEVVKGHRRKTGAWTLVRKALGPDDELLAALPKCAGEWLSGSGGHIKLGPCGKLATFEDPDDAYRYACDAHQSLLVLPGKEELPWAEAVRRMGR